MGASTIGTFIFYPITAPPFLSYLTMAFPLSFAIYVSLKEKSLGVSKSPRLSDGSGRRGSNPRPSAWKADALPTELLPQFGPFFKGDAKI